MNQDDLLRKIDERLERMEGDIKSLKDGQDHTNTALEAVQAGLEDVQRNTARKDDIHWLATKIGSGSLEQDSLICIGAMKKEQEACFVHHHRLGKRQGHADKTSETLAQGVIPALDMGGFSRFFADRGVLILRNYRLV